MLIPAVILGSLAGVATWKAYKSNRGVLTPERKTLYDRLMVSMADPEKLRMMADVYEKEGLSYEADMLRKRAALREQTPQQQAERKKVLQDALKSTDKEAVGAVANAFDQIGAVGAAQRLREYLAGLM